MGLQLRERGKTTVAEWNPGQGGRMTQAKGVRVRLLGFRMQRGGVENPNFRAKGFICPVNSPRPAAGCSPQCSLGVPHHGAGRVRCIFPLSFPHRGQKTLRPGIGGAECGAFSHSLSLLGVKKHFFALGCLRKMKMFPNRGLLPDCMGLMGTSVPKLHRGIACAALHVTDCMCKIALASA